MINQPNLGELVRELRRAAGLTQEELATRAGLSTRAISDLERGVNHVPRAATLQNLAAALGLSDREREHFDAVARAHEENPPMAAARASLPVPGPSVTTVAPGLPPLIGRAREREFLEQHLAGEGPPLLLIAAEPGMGKTRLLQEAAALGAAVRFNVLSGTVLSHGDPDSLDPIADALRHALQGRSPVLLRRDLQGCAPLIEMLPEVASLDWSGAESVRSGTNAAVMANGVLRFIANTAGPSGTLLTLDNLHDAAAPGLALLARLVRLSIDLPLRIVAAYRDGHYSGTHALSAVLAALSQERLVRHVALSPLSTRESADLLTAVATQRGQTMDPWPAQALRDSGGVPLYLVGWAEHLELLRQQHDAVVPWPIQQSVRFRIDAGPEAVRPVLDVLAAVGGRATHALLRDVVALAPHDVETALDWCVRQRLVVEKDEAYAFAYGVVQTAVDSDLNLTRRQLIRRRMATRFALTNSNKPSSGSGPDSVTDEERAYHIAVLRRGRASPDEPQSPES